MAIFFPPPPPFMGGAQPHDNRPLNPDVEAVAVNDPPFAHRGRLPATISVVHTTQPNPWTYNFPGGWQVFTPRKLAPAISAVPEDNPPFNRRSGASATAQGNIIVAIAQPDPWVYAYQGRSQPFEPRKLPPSIAAVPEDNPPFGHRGRAAYTAEIVALAQPNPWSGTFTGGRHPYGQRKLFPPALGVAIDNPPFSHWSRKAAHHAIIRSWEPPPPFPLKTLYDRSHVIQIRRVTGRGFILTWGARQAPVNYPPVTFGGPVNATMADVWSVMFASNWTYSFGAARQPYGKRITVIN